MSRAQRIGLLGRRLGAIAYDALLLVGVLFVATALAVAANGGQAIASGNPLYIAYLFTWSLAYFVWFWSRQGQTLGMRAWGLRVERDDGGRPTAMQSAARFLLAIISFACFGLGFLRIAIDPLTRAWHDQGSGTVLRATASPSTDASTAS